MIRLWLLHTLFILFILYSSSLTAQEIDKKSSLANYQVSSKLLKKPLPPQFLAFELSAIGNYKKSRAVFNASVTPDTLKMMDMPLVPNPQFLKNFDRLNAVEHITESASKYDVIIINEAHHMPHHRVFMQQLLGELRSIGYNKYCLEGLTFSEKNDAQLSKGIVNQETVLYLKEPCFGNMVKKAVSLGYEVFSYDIFGDNREVSSAKHIQSKVGEKDKLIIYCGFEHANENINNDPRWLASYVK